MDNRCCGVCKEYFGKASPFGPWPQATANLRSLEPHVLSLVRAGGLPSSSGTAFQEMLRYLGSVAALCPTQQPAASVGGGRGLSPGQGAVDSEEQVRQGVSKALRAFLSSYDALARELTRAVATSKARGTDSGSLERLAGQLRSFVPQRVGRDSTLNSTRQVSNMAEGNGIRVEPSHMIEIGSQHRERTATATPAVRQVVTKGVTPDKVQASHPMTRQLAQAPAHPARVAAAAPGQPKASCPNCAKKAAAQAASAAPAPQRSVPLSQPASAPARGTALPNTVRTRATGAQLSAATRASRDPRLAQRTLSSQGAPPSSQLDAMAARTKRMQQSSAAAPAPTRAVVSPVATTGPSIPNPVVSGGAAQVPNKELLDAARRALATAGLAIDQSQLTSLITKALKLAGEVTLRSASAPGTLTKTRG